jgi:hypothetical protein
MLWAEFSSYESERYVMNLVGAKIHYVNASKLPWVLQGFFSQQNSHGPAVMATNVV